MNPVPDAYGLQLNLSETDNALDLELVRSVAPYFRLDARAAGEIIDRQQVVVRRWRKMAGALRLSARGTFPLERPPRRPFSPSRIKISSPSSLAISARNPRFVSP